MPNLIVCTRIYRWKEIYREGSDGVEKWNHFLVTFSHAIFLTKSEKDCISWLNACYYGLHGKMIPYSMVKCLITMIVIGVEENEITIRLSYTLKNLKNANS